MENKSNKNLIIVAVLIVVALLFVGYFAQNNDKELTIEEKREILDSLETNGGDFTLEEKQKTIDELSAESTEEEGLTREDKIKVLESLMKKESLEEL